MLVERPRVSGSPCRCRAGKQRGSTDNGDRNAPPDASDAELSLECRDSGFPSQRYALFQKEADVLNIGCLGAVRTDIGSFPMNCRNAPNDKGRLIR